MITARPGAQTPAVDTAVPPLDDELDGLLEDLAGFGSGTDQLVDGLRYLALTAHSLDSTQTTLAVLAGNGPNIVTAIAALIARLGDPAQNPALRDLPADRQDQARELTTQYAHYDDQFAPHDLISETTAVIDGH
ncbi:hypothetical protein ACFV2X_38470 [Streptomyces sp. NPDC059679]|uniref:hypothetical protein n=1 Tax=Streptomyces sp. NPDC059679 TaxID=3346903 RepID=UPI00369B6707